MTTKTIHKNREVRFVMGLACVLAASTMASADQPRSGYEYLQQESRDMQDDDFLNPGMQSVDSGAELFNQPGSSGESCGSCHGENGARLDPERIAMYPVYDEKLEKPVTLQQRILIEWEERLGNKPMKYDSNEALELEVFVRHLARGEKVNVQTSGPMQPAYEKGKEIYQTRSGQLDMACTNCHDVYPGQKIRANTLSQGQSNGFPAYRLSNGRINGLQSRFNQCYQQFRAEEMPPGNDDYVALEVYVNARGNGLPIETPGVRY